MYRVTPNEFIAALVAENPNLNPDDLTGEVLGRKIALLAKGKRYAGKGATASKAYSLYENYNARKVTPYGATAGALLDYYNQHYVPGPLDVLAETSPSLLDKINSLDMSEEAPDSHVQLDENEIKSLIDFYINLYDRHKLDSNWLKELKNAIYPEKGTSRPFAAYLRKQNIDEYNEKINNTDDGLPPARASYIPFIDEKHPAQLTFNFGTVNKRQMNLNSAEGISRMLHEFYHAYQNYVLNMEWRDARVEKGANTHLDLDAYKKQFEIEDLFKTPKSPFRIQFEGYETQGLPDEKIREYKIRAIDNIRKKAEEERKKKNRSKHK